MTCSRRGEKTSGERRRTREWLRKTRGGLRRVSTKVHEDEPEVWGKTKSVNTYKVDKEKSNRYRLAEQKFGGESKNLRE